MPGIHKPSIKRAFQRRLDRFLWRIFPLQCVMDKFINGSLIPIFKIIPNPNLNQHRLQLLNAVALLF